MVITEGRKEKVFVIEHKDKCWMCNKLFNEEIKEDRRTYHHAIPKRFHPRYNIKIPVCYFCHQEINGHDEKYRRFVKGLSVWIMNRMNKLEKFDKG